MIDALRRAAEVGRFCSIRGFKTKVDNLFPLPPLDGGRIAVGLLPNVLANPLARLEPYGMIILIGLLIVLPLLGSQLGVDLSFVSHLISSATNSVIKGILLLTGNV